jgi:hypothetical protein
MVVPLIGYDRFSGRPGERIAVKGVQHFVVVAEELLTHVTMVTSEQPSALIRAEIAYFETVAGGAVFSITPASARRTAPPPSKLRHEPTAR